MVGEKKASLSALVVVHNEEKKLEKCLAALGFCDEIVVVLDRCTDKSEEIAQSKGAKTISGAWEIEGHRRNLGIESCQSTWVVEVDADEYISLELAKEIQEVIQTSPHDYHSLPFLNYIGVRPVRYGWGFSFGVTKRLSLFKKEAKKWGDQRVHPKVSFKGKEGAPLKCEVHHYVDENILSTINRLRAYSQARAKDLLESGKGKKETLGKNVRRFFTRFLLTYFKKQAYREGGLGFALAILTALFPLVSFLHYRELCCLEKKNQK